MALIWFTMLFGALMLSNTGVDERSKWTSYSLTMPCSRRNVVSAKYAVVGIVTVLLALIDLVAVLAMRTPAVSIYIIIAIGLAYPSITLPISYKLSSEKSMLALVFANCILVGGASGFVSTQDASVTSLENVRSAVGVFAAAAVVFYVLSWMLSIKLYEKRDIQ